MAVSKTCSAAAQRVSRLWRQTKVPSIQPSPRPPRPRRKYRISGPTTVFSSVMLLLLALASLIPSSDAVFINFDNCLDPAIRNSNDPVQLQFIPLYFWAKFNTTAPSHNLNITVYGNVSGQAVQGPYPQPDDPSWTNPNSSFGKIVDVSPTNNRYSTLFSEYNVLSYTPYSAPASEFCLSTVNTSCPIGPAFTANASDPYTLPAFTVAHDFYSSYAFSTFSVTLRVDSGDANAPHLACVSASVTPNLKGDLANALAYLPVAILAMVAVATVFAAICSPWGTSDPFRWTSNYGRDEDLLRLVTPGFGDCLQYIQFIVLAGSLNLAYPGYYQPVVSQASWSLLLFNESFVSHGNGSQSLVDGIYFTNGTYGLSRLGQLVGMSEEQDIWAGMAVWLLGLTLAVVLLGQLAFFLRWLSRSLSHNQEGDLRQKNWPFTAGNIVRMVFNYFLLPIIAISLFQLVVAPRSPASVVAMAVVLLLGVFATAIWIFWFIFTTRPRAHLFDDLPTVLMYGPLYNTYSDDAAPFAFIPVLLTCIRSIAIGAIQPSGIAQLVMLAICEVILILTLHAFRPFQSNTSMNAYHTFFSIARLITTLLSIAFVPSLGVAESSRGWIGYIILLIHGIVLVLGFFLNALQTIIEVGARLAGAGRDTRGGLTRVFGKRQLSRRNRHRKNQRSSLGSNAAMLGADSDIKYSGRARSLSASSAVLLNQPNGSTRASVGFDQFSQPGDVTPGTPGTGNTRVSFVAGGGSGTNSRRTTMGTMDVADPYYRPPRPRKGTNEFSLAGTSNRISGTSSELKETAAYADSPEQAEAGDAGEGPSFSPNRGSITPAYLRMHKDDSDPALAERRKDTDYAVRESDYYYGLRGPALNDQPTRKLKTGPADPMGPVSSATGFFKTLFGGKRKEKGKGFEVVRSTRIPPQMMPVDEDDEEAATHEPYKDNPDSPPSATAAASSDRRKPSGDLGEGYDGAGQLIQTEHDSDEESEEDPFDHHMNRISAIAPTLGPIETGGGIELPSRIGSRASRMTQRSGQGSRAPTIPRRSSRRTNSTEQAILENDNRHLSTITASPPSTPGRLSAHLRSSSDVSTHLQPNPNALPVRLPFGSSEPSPSPERTPGHSAASSVYRLQEQGYGDTLAPPQSVGERADRPLSTGYVGRHLAREMIRGGSFDPGDHLESSAEVVDGRSRSRSTGRSARSERSG